MTGAVRRIVAIVATLIALVLCLMPVITGEREIAVRPHHIDHAVLMLFGVILGLALYRRRDERETSIWIWPALLAPVVAMLLMAPSLYALVNINPWLHSLDHTVLVALGALTAYAGQRYVNGVGWATALFLESMAVTAAFGYGVAPSVAIPSAPPAHVQSAATAGDATHGKLLFAQNCAACHGAKGEGGGMAPSLEHETSRKSYAQTVSWIEKPAPPMPALYPNPLGAQDVADLAAFVETLK